MTSESEKSKEKKQNQLQRRLEELNTNYNFLVVDSFLVNNNPYTVGILNFCSNLYNSKERSF